MSRSVTEVQFWSLFFFTILVVAGPNGIGVVLRDVYKRQICDFINVIKAIFNDKVIYSTIDVKL